MISIKVKDRLIRIKVKHALLDLEEEIEAERTAAIENERIASRERIKAIKAEYRSLYTARKAVLLENMVENMAEKTIED